MTTVAVSATTGSHFSLSPQPPTAPFFIFGCPRSGTSLLSAMLGMHSRLAIPQESHFYSGIYPVVHRFGDLGHASTRTRLVERDPPDRAHSEMDAATVGARNTRRHYSLRLSRYCRRVHASLGHGTGQTPMG